jgi:hypothetical protein
MTGATYRMAWNSIALELISSQRDERGLLQLKYRASLWG